MCMEDVRINRRSTTTTGTLAVSANTPTQVLPQRFNRLSLRVVVITSGTPSILTWIDKSLPVPTSVSGGTQSELILDLTHHGDAVTQPVWVFFTADNVRVFWSETILEIQ